MTLGLTVRVIPYLMEVIQIFNFGSYSITKPLNKIVPVFLHKQFLLYTSYQMLKVDLRWGGGVFNVDCRIPVSLQTNTNSSSNTK